MGWTFFVILIETLQRGTHAPTWLAQACVEELYCDQVPGQDKFLESWRGLTDENWKYYISPGRQNFTREYGDIWPKEPSRVERYLVYAFFVVEKPTFIDLLLKVLVEPAVYVLCRVSLVFKMTMQQCKGALLL